MMEVSFKELSEEAGGYLRPVVDVSVGGQDDVLSACLVDTGSLHNRFGRWVATASGLDVDAGDPVRFALGGIVTAGVTIPVDLRVGDYAWRAPVTFCDPWPLSFNVLGQEGFFRFFAVMFRAAHMTFALEPDLGPPA